MSRLTFVRLLFLLLAPLALISASNAAGVRVAKADISGPNGITGTALFTDDGKGNVLVSVFVKGDPSVLTPGRHGFHIHENGTCDAPAFTTAGGHYDPGPNGNSATVANHPFHMGDLENVSVNSRGEGTLLDITTRVSLDPANDVTVFDANGSAVILHALEDQRSCQAATPGGPCTGVSGGGRLACGVIVPVIP